MERRAGLLGGPGGEVGLASAPSPWDVARLARLASGAAVVLHGGRGFEDAWPVRVAAVRADPMVLGGDGAAERLDALERALEHRRRDGATAGTGVAVAVAFEFFDGRPTTEGLLIVDVPVAIRYGGPGDAAALVSRDPDLVASARREVARIEEAPPNAGLGTREVARTSLPRARYLEAVERIRGSIRDGDVYQANLCQRFETVFAGDPLGAFRRLVEATPAPRSAYLESGGRALASASPEIFVDAAPDGRVRTLPIKGTRRRGTTPEEDEALRGALARSTKDRAELTMIVDLERNDLGRVCRWGSVRVAGAGEVRTFPAVHHLVAEITGRLRPDVGIRGLLEAVFPGGSISGAPKRRALEILREIEPRGRGFFTGALLWLGDDGSLASSILIRTAEIADGVVRIGAGGGIVADSVPEAEWRESCDKARALTRCFGFEPEEAR